LPLPARNTTNFAAIRIRIQSELMLTLESSNLTLILKTRFAHRIYHSCRPAYSQDVPSDGFSTLTCTKIYSGPSDIQQIPSIQKPEQGPNQRPPLLGLKFPRSKACTIIRAVITCILQTRWVDDPFNCSMDGYNLSVAKASCADARRIYDIFTVA
jgi:hypothetical protein